MVEIRPHYVVFMKAGPHADEDLDAIVERKRAELEQAGVIFWGYGGTVCHPLTQIRPFVARVESAGEKVAVVMVRTKTTSSSTSGAVVARTYSETRRDWIDMPEGVRVTGSKYALVLSRLDKSIARLDLSRYEVAVGPKEGRAATGYIRGHCDKGCLRLRDSNRAPQFVDVCLLGELTEPFAVFLSQTR
jgi:hypothetical protein